MLHAALGVPARKSRIAVPGMRVPSRSAPGVAPAEAIESAVACCAASALE